jgi:hypothetical protein
MLLPTEFAYIKATRFPFTGPLAMIMLSDDASLPKSNIGAQLMLLSDLHHVAKVNPSVPVVKGSIFIY